MVRLHGVLVTENTGVINLDDVRRKKSQKQFTSSRQSISTEQHCSILSGLNQKTSDEPTVSCFLCQSFRSVEPGPCRRPVTENHLCMASPLPKKIDPLTGFEATYNTDDLGREYFTRHLYQYCSRVNSDGHCKKFRMVHIDCD